MEGLRNRIKLYEEKMHDMTTMTDYDEWMTYSREALNIINATCALIEEHNNYVVGVVITKD